MKRTTFRLALLAILIPCTLSAGKAQWVGTWATAEQLVEPHNCPPAPGLGGNSIRQIVHTSISGNKIRLKFSNEFSQGPVEIKAVEIAKATTMGASSDIVENTTHAVLFNGKPSITIAPGEYVISDAFSYKLGREENIAITMHLGQASSTNITGHPGSRTTSYIAEGNTSDFSNAVKTDHWYIINAIEVYSKTGQSIVVLGNSITDGRGTTTNGQNRWTDVLAHSLGSMKGTEHISVLNMGLGGNCVIRGGLGAPASQRYKRDLFGQGGVKYIILFEGINDLGGSRNGEQTAEQIINIFTQIAKEAKEQGIKVFGATVAPFKGNRGYFNADREHGRQVLNNWIKTTDLFDGYIDIAAAVCSANDPEQMDTKYLFENDFLHYNADGYQVMGKYAAEQIYQFLDKVKKHK